MDAAIQKADVLIEALGWIRRFREKITVIKLGGSLLHDREALMHVLLDLVFMETVGMKPIIVHGGGNAISKAMNQAGIEPHFIQGRRYTDQQTLEIVKEVLAKGVNQHLVNEITRLEGTARAFNFWTKNVLFGEKITLQQADGSPIDLGNVGRVIDVDTQALHDCCDEGFIPVIPSMCQEIGSDDVLNVNADTAATTVAQKMGADKLVYISDVNGVRRDPNDPDSRIPSLTETEARQLIDQGIISSGMIPKVEACLETLKAGVKKVHIVDGNLRHSLLLEIYTTTGIGTELVADPE